MIKARCNLFAVSGYYGYTNSLRYLNGHVAGEEEQCMAGGCQLISFSLGVRRTLASSFGSRTLMSLGLMLTLFVPVVHGDFFFVTIDG